MKKYEAMFVLENSFAGKEWEPVEAELRAILDRFGGEVETLEKWGERRLAYEIKKQRRAVYAHIIFQLDPNRVTEMRDHIKLDERILRSLILRFNPKAQTHLPAENLFGARPAKPAAKDAAKPETKDAATPEAKDAVTPEPETKDAAKPETKEAEAVKPVAAEAETPAVVEADTPAAPEAKKPTAAEAEKPAVVEAEAPAAPEAESAATETNETA